MANKFFENFPEMQYKLDSGKIITIKDFFRKSSIEPAAKEAIIDYTFYELEEGDRPDVVAGKLYGNPELHWVFFLVNDFENYYDWYKSQRDFESYIKHKYRGKFLVASSSTDIVSSTSKFLIGEEVTATDSKGIVISVEPTYNRIAVEVEKGFLNPAATTGTNSTKSFTPSSIIDQRDGACYYYKGDLKSNHFISGYQERTFYEEEYIKNEEKRQIKVIKPAMINRIVSQFEKVMKS